MFGARKKVPKMTAKRFESLTVLSRILVDKKGFTDLCRTDAGEKEICISILDRRMQEGLLLELDRSIPVLFEAGCLKLLLPWQEGRSLKEWIFYENPSFVQRRRACMSLLEQLLTQPIPAGLLLMCARVDNLRFDREAVRLQLFPELNRWNQETEEADAIPKIAEMMVQILTDGLSCRVDQEYPDELKLLLIRSSSGAYRTLEMLQADLNRLPDELASRVRRLIAFRNRIYTLANRCRPAAVRIVAVVLVLAALVSAGGALLRWLNAAEEEKWPGIPQIGFESMTGKEAEAP